MSISQPKAVETADEKARGARGFMLRLGRALHSYGFPAHRLELVMEKASERLELPGQFFSTQTALFASFGPQDEQQTYLMRVKPGEVNLGKIAELDEVATVVLRGALDPSEGSQRIDQILSDPPRYRSFVVMLAYGVASAAASRFLGGGLKEIGISGLIGLAIGLLSLAIEKHHSLGRVFEPLAAFTASFLAVSLSFVAGPYAVSNSMLAGLIVLMPGLNLTVAMIELSTQHLTSGTARLSKSFVIFLAVGFGVALGDSVVSSILGEPQIARADRLPGWTEIIAVVMMAIAFTVLLRAHLNDAIWILIAGALAVGGSKIGVQVLGPELGVFLGAMIVGVASNMYARLLDRPAIITQTPGIMFLVPGSVGFRALAALLDEKIISGVETTFKMIITAVALVAGTLIANIVAPSRREI
jgi:uncharacterized membrane protein YjjP (DUF1212 family)